jgi:hypothetical protein
LRLTQEGYSPKVVRLAVRQAAQAPSFAEASDDLREPAGVSISATHRQRLCERVGPEWAQARDGDVEPFRRQQLQPVPAEPPAVAAVMPDGGRLPTRAAEEGRGVPEPAWQETKVACCLSLSSTEKAVDPQPEPPPALRDPPAVARLAVEMKARRVAGASRAEQGRRGGAPPKKKRRPSRRQRRQPRKLVRTVVARMADSDTFGWQVAAEVQRRRLGEAGRKACVCDGPKWNGTIFLLHLLPWGFVGILDFIHLAVHLYAAAQAVGGKPGEAWLLYEQWLRWAWSGEVKRLPGGLRQAAKRRGVPPPEAKEDDPRPVLADVVGYVENNRDKMDYPRYRRQGLPITSAPVESVIKQVNRRVKGSEKFWLRGGVEGVLQVRAAYLSEDGRADRHWARPRPRGRAVGSGRLGRRR